MWFLEEAEGEKSFFNRSTALLVNVHLETSDGANKNGGGPVDGAGRTMNPGGGVATVVFLIRPEKNRPGVRDQSSGNFVKSMVSPRAS